MAVESKNKGKPLQTPDPQDDQVTTPASEEEKKDNKKQKVKKKSKSAGVAVLASKNQKNGNKLLEEAPAKRRLKKLKKSGSSRSLDLTPQGDNNDHGDEGESKPVRRKVKTKSSKNTKDGEAEGEGLSSLENKLEQEQKKGKKKSSNTSIQSAPVPTKNNTAMKGGEESQSSLLEKTLEGGKRKGKKKSSNNSTATGSSMMSGDVPSSKNMLQGGGKPSKKPRSKAKSASVLHVSSSLINRVKNSSKDEWSVISPRPSLYGKKAAVIKKTKPSSTEVEEAKAKEPSRNATPEIGKIPVGVETPETLPEASASKIKTAEPSIEENKAVVPVKLLEDQQLTSPKKQRNESRTIEPTSTAEGEHSQSKSPEEKTASEPLVEASASQVKTSEPSIKNNKEDVRVKLFEAQQSTSPKKRGNESRTKKTIPTAEGKNSQSRAPEEKTASETLVEARASQIKSSEPSNTKSKEDAPVKKLSVVGSNRQVFEHKASDVPDWARKVDSNRSIRSTTSSPKPGNRPSTSTAFRQSSSISSEPGTPTNSPRSSSSIRSISSGKGGTISIEPQEKESPIPTKHNRRVSAADRSPALKQRMSAFSSSMSSLPSPGQMGIIGLANKASRSPRGRESNLAVTYETPPQESRPPAAGLEAFNLPFSSSDNPEDTLHYVTPKRRSKKELSQFASSKNAIIEALATPARKKKEALADIEKTPRTLKRGFVDLNVNAPRRSGAKTPGQRFMDTSHHGKEKARTYVDFAVDLLTDESQKAEVERLVSKIESLGGFPKTRRLSMRDNELVGKLVMAVRNDPRITEVHVDAGMFGSISSTLLSQFIDSLRVNLHVKSLSFHGLELGNDFLYDLAASMESNFVVEEINLSSNLFTNEGLANFCQALALTNDSVKRLNLKNQTTPISEASQVDVLEAFTQNRTLNKVDLDFISDDGPEKLEKLLDRNRLKESDTIKTNMDDKLIGVLTDELERAQELWDQQQAEMSVAEEEDYDWEYLYELAVLFDKHKLKKAVEESVKELAGPPKRTNADDLNAEDKKKFLFGAFKKNMEESVMAFKEDGSFLTPEFIAKYFKERPDEDALDFDFHGQWKLFKRFPVHDPARQVIVDKFVDAIATHPRAKELTGINMANTGAGDDFLVALSKRCLEVNTLLPNLHTVNFETNFINEPGVVALANMVASPDTCKFMQVIRLENQKGLLKSKAEFALAKAMRVNRSIVVISLTIRNLLERERLGKYIMRNVDLMRQARQEHMKATGTQRKRNKVELVFDRVKENDENLTEVNMMGNERFLTLTQEEKVKAARSFALNHYVKEIRLNGCGIDDDFARALGESFITNTTVEKVHLEANDISGEGIKALFVGLGKNSNIKELRLHKQSKLLATADEETLADLLEDNHTVTKIGMDLRSQVAQVKLDRKMGYNINHDLKEKAASKKD